MAKAVQMLGVDKLISKLKGSLRKEKAAAFSRGVRECGAQLLRLSLPLVPVQTGVLRASGDVRVTGKGFSTVVHTSFGTDYGIWVHEVPSPQVTHGAEFNAKHASKIASARKAKRKGKPGAVKYWFNRGPKQQYKFLEQPFRENHDDFLQIIKTELETN
jgi:hypothetical protein